MHRVDDDKRLALAGVTVHQVARVTLAQRVQNARLVEITQLCQILDAIKLRRICLKTTIVHITRQALTSDQPYINAILL